MPRKIVAVGHRGTINAPGIPENTLAAHNWAYSNGARGIEFDIQCTADGEFVLFHDSKMKYKSTGHGSISDHTRDDLGKFWLKKDEIVTNYQIPTLLDALSNVNYRFMVDLDFKTGPDDSATIIRKALKATDFHLPGAPLVTIFCRDDKAYDLVKDLKDICHIRPVYRDKKHAREMRDQNIKIMGLRHHKFTPKRARRIRGYDMELFSNIMKYSWWELFRMLMGWSENKRKKPKLEELYEDYQRAVDGDSLFIQTDYISDLKNFLNQKDLYQTAVLGRNFKPIPPRRGQS